jgi:hypothetical protein
MIGQEEKMLSQGGHLDFTFLFNSTDFRIRSLCRSRASSDLRERFFSWASIERTLALEENFEIGFLTFSDMGAAEDGEEECGRRLLLFSIT